MSNKWYTKVILLVYSIMNANELFIILGCFVTNEFNHMNIKIHFLSATCYILRD